MASQFLLRMSSLFTITFCPVANEYASGRVMCSSFLSTTICAEVSCAAWIDFAGEVRDSKWFERADIEG